MTARMNERQSAPTMVIVMGVTGAGKSYFVNKLAGKELVKEGASLESCTQHCTLAPVSIGGSRTLLIDTPGFDDTQREDAEILEEIARILSAQYQAGVQLKGIIYIHRITDIRFTRGAVKTFEIFKKICGEDALKNVFLVTSRWNEIDPALGADRERQLKERFWSYMVARGSKISRFYGDRDSAISLVSQLITREHVVLQLQKELVDEGKDLNTTVAGSYLDENLERMKQQVRDELASIERLKQDLLEHDQAMRRQALRDWERETARLSALQNQQVSMQHPVGTEVGQEIEKKKKSGSGLSRVLPGLVPAAISIMLACVGIPPEVSALVTGWFTDSGSS